jgi:hypothetical protein
MIKTILTFLIIWVVIFFGFSYLWHISRSQKIDMLKMAVYSLATGVFAMFFLLGLVVLF